MKVYSKTRKSHYWNEDRFINGKSYSVVIDGATPLKSSAEFNEARWMVDYLKKNFSAAKGSVKERLLQLCKNAYRDMPINVKESDYLPSASASWVEFTREKIGIGIVGDCEVTAVCHDGTILRFHDERLGILDRKAIDEMIRIANEQRLSMREARKLIQETLIRHRRLANRPNGYSALVLSHDPEIHETYSEIDASRIRTLYLYSDGFSQAFETLHLYASHEEMFRRIESIDAEIEKIVSTSLRDADCNNYPRFKKIDDITIVQIDL